MKQKLVEHLKELRKRVIVFLLFNMILTSFLFFRSKEITSGIISSLIKNPEVRIASFTLIEAMSTQMRLSLWLSLLISIPTLGFVQTYLFTKPAFKKKEEKIAGIILPFSSALFFLGVLFSFYILLPPMIDFFIRYTTSSGFLMLFSAQQLFSFITWTMLSTGLMFELPLFMILLVKTKVAKLDSLKKSRRYVYLGIVIFCAAITPDVTFVSQLLLAVPMILLFELGLILARIF